MRFIPSSCLKSGMIIAKNLYGNNNELMLSKGQVLTDMEINRIRLLEFQGIYITDNISADIEVSNIISSRLGNSTVKAVKDIFMNLENKELPFNNEKTRTLKSMVDDIVGKITVNPNAIINMLDLKAFNNYTYYHSVNVAVLSIVIGISLGLNKNELYKLGLGALLHDIGKVFIPKEVLEKKGKLDDEEFKQIQQHSVKGSNYLKEKWDIPIESTIAILNHHEKYDGSGYPLKLKSEKISLFGRIVAVADVFDALTSNRPYRVTFSPLDAMEYIMGGSGTQFDPKIVSAFAKSIVPYPVGTCVELSNNLKGIVDHIGFCMRPKVRIIGNTNNGKEIYYDLYNDKNLLNVTIKGIAIM